MARVFPVAAVAATDNILHRLSAASCLLLSTAHAQSEPWIIDLGVMNYNEQDLNTGVEFLLKASRETASGGKVKVGLELDVITGATPNGATPTDTPQTFTMASGEGFYRVDANQLPVDDTHMDTRMSVSAGLETPIDYDLTLETHGLISMEFDFLAFATGFSLSQEFNAANTSLSFGLDLEYDLVHPVGDIPTALAQMLPPGDTQPRGESSASRRVHEVSLGLTQVLNRRSIVQAKLSYSDFSGYLTDPYKLLSVIDNQNLPTLGQTLFYRYENRPDSRYLKSLYLAYKQAIEDDVLDLSYRYFKDSWDISSHTLEAGYKHRLQKKLFWRPSIRLYQQSAAYFFHHSIKSDQAVVTVASADSRLAEFNGITVGVEYGRDLDFGRKHSLTFEYYQQEGDSHPADAVGVQQQQDLFAGVKTLVLKYIYAIKW